MCGIVAYLGPRSPSDVLLEGLRRLEYRGYDSAGIATVDGGQLHVKKTPGRVQSLETLLRDDPPRGHAGIAHTRWATHGRPNEVNAHPHTDAGGKIALVHNGIVENHAAIREYLVDRGVTFVSDTDTEVMAQLIGRLYAETGDMTRALRQALRRVQGTYGMGLICVDEPDVIYAARKGSPLIVGTGADEMILASDAGALVGHVSLVTYLEDGEIVRLTRNGAEVTTINAADPIEKTWSELDITLEQIDLGQFEHHMLKEIYEQPAALRNTFRGRVRPETGELKLGGMTPVERLVPQCKRVLLFGCGSAWHAGLIGEFLFEELAELPTEVHYASELRYRNPIVEEGTLAIAISQSGETADTLAALEELRTRGATTLGVVNVVGSSIARETDAGVYLHVGPEIGVASTKAFLAQVAVLTIMAIYMGRRRHLSQEKIQTLLDGLDELPDLIEQTLGVRDQIADIAHRLVDRNNWLYLGRGVNYPVALEGALKLKEVSYVHAEGLPAAEMKHGPIAMIDPNMPVVVLAPRDHTYDKVLSNIEEVRSRDGQVIAIASQPDKHLESLASDVVYIPPTLPILSPMLSVIPLQLLAYDVAVARGKDVDRPRNLAKSVTVE